MGKGVPHAVTMMQHLLPLEHDCAALLDSGEPPSLDALAALK